MKDEIKKIWVDLNEELFDFIYNRVKSKEVANDILQEVFLKVQLRIHQLRETSKLTSWVYQITRNTIIDYYRSLNKKNIPLEHIDLPEDENESLDYAKLNNCINQKINLLSSQYKEAIILTSFKEYSQKELAQHLQISYSGAKSRVQRAKDLLKESILNCPKVESDSTGKIIDYE
ncbi:sigma-70 family RNA polymerase sigma factor [Xanthovirga aplysinae]|uniref:sigma-70 family RNA polymerase sigma factor n=1 Tax=Xanthovirga aplysinae TaxID=2529853 RepID=UPI0012BD282E|nr:sigma-70 family RNA polymerase sigma factor [Xanthovirga aplysinae]MTI33015.1 sigma-70 family RNA polymerase sigma factor [Xanthovirga aplysinae]